MSLKPREPLTPGDALFLGLLSGAYLSWCGVSLLGVASYLSAVLLFVGLAHTLVSADRGDASGRMGKTSVFSVGLGVGIAPITAGDTLGTVMAPLLAVLVACLFAYFWGRKGDPDPPARES